MGFETKTDYCGLTSIAETLLVRDDNENATTETYQPNGGNGEILGIEAFGDDSVPSNNYGIPSPGVSFDDGDIKLNSLTTVGGKKFALESISIQTGPSTPTLSATSQEVEAAASANNQCVFALPAFSISSKHHAQILFGAFTLSGQGANLTACGATATCQIDKDKVEGVKIASDAISGLITVTGTILVKGSTVPTLTAATGWTRTRFSCANPESQWKNYSFELVYPLTKTEPSAAS